MSDKPINQEWKPGGLVFRYEAVKNDTSLGAKAAWQQKHLALLERALSDDMQNSWEWLKKRTVKKHKNLNEKEIKQLRSLGYW